MRSGVIRHHLHRPYAQEKHGVHSVVLSSPQHTTDTRLLVWHANIRSKHLVSKQAYGSYNDLVLDASGIRGQSVVTWDFDSQDSMGASVQTSKNLYTNTINRHPSTILALNHEPIETTAHQVLPFAIQKLQAAGYKLVTLAQCLGKQPYQRTAAPQARDSTWHC